MSPQGQRTWWRTSVTARAPPAGGPPSRHDLVPTPQTPPRRERVCCGRQSGRFFRQDLVLNAPNAHGNAPRGGEISPLFPRHIWPLCSGYPGGGGSGRLFSVIQGIRPTPRSKYFKPTSCSIVALSLSSLLGNKRSPRSRGTGYPFSV